MKRILLLIIFIVSVITSCSNDGKTYTKRVVDGVEIISNKNIPADPDFKIDLKKKFTISADSIVKSVSYMTLDKDNNLYFVDFEKNCIHKFDEKGNHIKSFGKKGNGPGEFSTDLSVFSIIDDNIYVYQPRKLMFTMFDSNGNFIENKTYNDYTDMPYRPLKFGSNFISLKTKINWKDDSKNEAIYISKISFYNSDLKYEGRDLCIKESLWSKKNKNVIYDPQTFNFKWAISEKYVYVVKSLYDYSIDVYDTKGNHVKKIKKSYRLEPLPDELKQKMEQNSKRVGLNFVRKHKKVIHDIHIDSYDNIWIQTTSSDDSDTVLSFDIFKDGIYLKSLSFDRKARPLIVKDKIIFKSPSMDEIKVYQF